MLRFFSPFGIGEEFGVVEYADGDSGAYFFPEFSSVPDVSGGGLERQAFPTSFTPRYMDHILILRSRITTPVGIRFVAIFLPLLR